MRLTLILRLRPLHRPPPLSRRARLSTIQIAPIAPPTKHHQQPASPAAEHPVRFLSSLVDRHASPPDLSVDFVPALLYP